jgi:hypothetical protein
VPRGSNPLQAALPLAGRGMRLLGAVMQIPLLPRCHPGQACLPGRPVAVPCGRDHHPRHVRHPLQARAEHRLRRPLVATALDEHRQTMAVLVDGPPQVVACAMDGPKHLVRVPRIPGAGAPPTELMGRGLPAGPAPIRPASEVRITPRSAISSSTSRELRPKRTERQTP